MSRLPNAISPFHCLATLTALTLLVLPSPDLNVQLALLAGGLVAIGIPHGAVDPLLAKEDSASGDRLKWTRFIAVYVFQVVAVLVTWWLLPGLALIAFLLLSAWHFGGDWRHCLTPLTRWLAGLAVVLAPLAFHPTAVAELFVLLMGPAGHDIANAGFWLACLGIASMTAQTFATKQASPGDRLDWAVLLLLAVAAPPLLYFAVYFCALHSARHLQDAIRHQTDTPVWRWWLVGGLISAVTFLAGAVVFFAIPNADVTQRVLQLVFIGLAALTVPHMTLVERVHKRWQRAQT